MKPCRDERYDDAVDVRGAGDEEEVNSDVTISGNQKKIAIGPC
jgi:hypothetical protein